MSDLPANRLDISRREDGQYMATEYRSGSAVLYAGFQTVEEVIAYALRYAGIVTASADLILPAYDAGLLVVPQ